MIGMQSVAGAQDLLSKGKKHLLLDEYEQAVDTFEEACKLVSEKLGEFADECAEPYFLYGKALLEFGRSENNVLNEEPLDEDDGESEEEDNVKDENQNGNGDIANQTNKITNGSNEPEIMMDVKITDEKINSPKENKIKDETINEESQIVTNFQLAWEVLDLSRIILSKKDDIDSKIKLSETFLKLGEVSLEIENYEKAISDLLDCLEIQKKYLDVNDRRIAETCYTLSLSYSFVNNYDSASKSLQEAIDIINNKIESLKNLAKERVTGTEADGMEEEDESRDEVGELEALLKDLHEKMEEIKESQDKPFLSTSLHHSNGSVENSDAQQNKSNNTESHIFVDGNDILGLSSSSATKEVDDITHLVKRKKTE